jgi:hypothetical protein
MQNVLFVANVILCPLTVGAAFMSRYYARRATESKEAALAALHDRRTPEQRGARGPALWGSL